jgi:hypothetical protein
MDVRFCSLCAGPRPTSTPHRRTGDTTSSAIYTLEDVVRFLNEQKIRATYGAVAEVVGGIAQGIGARLDRLYAKNPQASWVVNAESGLPTGYNLRERHPSLLISTDVITNGGQLQKRMMRWKTSRS